MPLLPRRFERIKSVLNRRISDLTVLIENVEKPHNLSAIIRSCDAVGVLEAYAIFNKEKFLTFNSTAQGSQKWVQVNQYKETTEAIKVLKKKGFKLFGTKYPTEDGTCVRDYVHVMDLADAHVKSLNYAFENKVAEVFNLGSGSPVSNRELLDTIQRHTGKMDIKFEPNRAGDPAYLVADITKVKQILGWEPTQSSIDNVVATALKWYNKVHKKNIQ